MRFLLTFVIGLLALTGQAFSQAAVLRNNDSFEMRLGGVPLEFASEYALQYTVGDDGTVNVPHIGSVRASGLSTSQFASNVAQKLQADKIFTNPSVHVNLVPQSRFVTVGGAVRAPQAVPWTQDMTLSAAISRAGGFTEFANRKNIRATREGQLRVFNLTKPEHNVKLLPGDEIEVRE